MSVNTDNPRRLVLELLKKAEDAKQFSNIALDKALEASRLSSVDKRLASTLFYGVIERRITLDFRISELSDKPLSELDSHTLNALRLGLYQLIFTDKIPAHAAINETVSLCPRRSSGFVNAILRAHTRKGDIRYPDKEENPALYLSVAYSVGLPLCEKFISAFGTDKTESILKAISRPPKTTIRVNTVKISVDELLAKTDGAEKTEISPVGLRVSGAVRELYGFDKGYFFVQDEASQICVEAIDAKPDFKLMDICACPGSKSFGCAINMQNKGEVFSFDLHQKKLSLILSGASRLGLDIIKVAEQDGRIPLSEHFESADRVLCDVPCSGFGVLGKKPELRYKDPADSKALPGIQLAILENACKYVKSGGVLVYSTCTVFPEENEENVFRFLDKHPEFSLSPFSVGTLSVPTGYLTLLPDEHPTDGFFVAKLIKRI